ncbi:MAG: S-methyl-5-thioribose-1-phosphate isomerase, partial [Thermoanaerobaculia bacterium]
MPATATPLVWREGSLAILDQRLLPHREIWIDARAAAEVAAAIAGMAVRGAPAIGIAAAYGVALEARRAAAGGDVRAA